MGPVGDPGGGRGVGVGVRRGTVSARLGGAHAANAALRNVIVGTATMALAHAVGRLVGVAI
ncbi:MAG: hypothetical protein LBS56_10980 [Propionibacteriaceae bacterium]|nr:hypothetical protein [Propionibacteriaceae bacterium]